MKFLTAPEGFVGNAALREAAAGEFGDIIRLLRKALFLKLQVREEWNVNIVGVFHNTVVIRQYEKYQQFSYTIDENNKVSLGEPVEVTREFTPVTATKLVEAWDCPLVEAASESGRSMLVNIIQSGVSENHVNYTPAVLREATQRGLFNCAVYVKSDREHINSNNPDFTKLHGEIRNSRYIESTNGAGYVQGELRLLETAEHTPKIAEAVQGGFNFGVSINAFGPAKVKGKFKEALSISRVDSVDVIMRPGAGGRVVKFIESENPDYPTTTQNNEPETAMLEKMIEAIKASDPKKLEGLDQSDPTAVLTAYTEAVQQSQTDVASEIKSALEVHQRLVEARNDASNRIDQSQLPQPAKDRVKAIINSMTKFTESDVEAEIKKEADYLAQFSESGKPANLGNGGPMYGDSPNGKEMLDALLDRDNQDVVSLREAYIDCTGDRNVTGMTRNCSDTRLVEALDSQSFPMALGDALTRRMTRDYQTQTDQQPWRLIADPVPVSDFRMQQRTRIGGYGDLPRVLEGAPYLPLTSPGDASIEYKIEKYGGIETITLEMIANDDVGALLRIPGKLVRSANRTLNKFVFGFVMDNPVVFDGKNLFHVDHGNLLTSALSESTYSTARTMMKSQREDGSNEKLGIPPSYLFVHDDGEEAAYNLFKRKTEQEEQFIHSNAPMVVPVTWFEDANDWIVAANLNEIPLIEIGFLNGNETPELFIQDNPTMGSMFTNDQTTYKMRHIFGGNALDYRGFVKSVVV